MGKHLAVNPLSVRRRLSGAPGRRDDAHLATHSSIRLLSFMTCAALALPFGAAAQPAAFSEAFIEFAAAVEGTFGDEGPRAQAALDRMTAALSGWDRILAAAELQFDTPDASRSASTRVRAHVDAGRGYAQRGRRVEALRHFEAAAALAQERSDVHLLRGLVLSSLGRASDAAEAFGLAWTLDPRDPIASYYALHAAAGRDPEQVRRTREALTDSLAGRMAAGTDVEPLRLPDLGLDASRSHDAPILPMHAYAHGYALIARGDYDAAVVALREALAADPLLLDPAGRDAAFRQAVLALRAGRLADARSLIESSNGRESPESQRVLGLIRWAESDDGAAAIHLERAAREAPRDERARLALSRVLASAGRPAEERHRLEDTARLFPDSAVAHWWLARSYTRENLLEEAHRAYQRVAPRVLGGRSALLEGFGRLSAAAADSSSAIEAFSAAVASDVNSASAHMHLGAALMVWDRTDEALAEFAAAALIDPRQPRAPLGIGEIHLNAGRYEQAVGALQHALALSPTLTAARYALAAALMRLGRSMDAAREFARVADEQRVALEDRRRRLALDVLKEEAALRASEGDHDRAAALWEQVVAREPGGPLNHVAFGAALAAAGRLDAAIEQYERAIALGAAGVALQPLEQLYLRAGRSLDAARTAIQYRRGLPEKPAQQVVEP